ncbi:NAD(P)H-binding protein [Brachybacterium sp. AOP43-C2-M15]|uniref:NAD(P)H-binding protein n=1 Tax=Brachybacterium sp. AOP43-C2-M15 TaxID=3457661 RepID=UPI0040345BD7
MTILVTGATGTIGRALVRALTERGQHVRALSRDPSTADLPTEVEVVQGDLTDPPSLAAALDGVSAVHLIGFDAPRGAGGGDALTTAPAVVEAAERAGVRRATVLHNGIPGGMDAAVQHSSLEWTVLAPVGFMANALWWAEAIRTEAEVAEPRGDSRGAIVHEADVADVAATALTEAGHGGRSYVITGPEAVSTAEQVSILAEAIGQEITFRELSDEEAIERWRSWGFDDEAVEFMTWTWESPIGATPTDTVQRVAGGPGRTFAQWAAENAEQFR